MRYIKDQIKRAKKKKSFDLDNDNRRKIVKMHIGRVLSTITYDEE